jgi:hypothetical protein
MLVSHQPSANGTGVTLLLDHFLYRLNRQEALAA